jgi:glyoxylase-like metal-dependent hydrolase (beta-lactamase superfamily II)
MIPFVVDQGAAPGVVETLSPRVRRVTAANAGPFTGPGTGVHIVGHGEVAIIDPGPDDPAHLAAILAATSGETITHIFVTHRHLDHSELARPLAALTGATIFAGPEDCKPSDGAARLEAGDDLAFRPDVGLKDGARFFRPGWTIEAVATPGHTAGHYAFALTEERSLFPGDCVMGWSTSVVSPPDGDMGQYMTSLAKIKARRFDTLRPTHGPAIEAPERFLTAYIGHRRLREAQILETLDLEGPSCVRRLVGRLYGHVDRRLHPAAAHTVLAHLIKLASESRVECVEGLPTMRAIYRISRWRAAA